jgi:hypothetical protein
VVLSGMQNRALGPYSAGFQIADPDHGIAFGPGEEDPIPVLAQLGSALLDDGGCDVDCQVGGHAWVSFPMHAEGSCHSCCGACL